MAEIINFQSEKQSRIAPTESINLTFHIFSDSDIRLETDIQDTPENRIKISRLFKNFIGIGGETVPAQEAIQQPVGKDLVSFLNGLIFGVVASTVVALVIVFL